MPTAPTAAGGYLNTDEVRERFFGGVSAQTIRRYISDEGLPSHRVGRRHLFNPAEVDDWIRSRIGEATSDRSAESATETELDEHVRGLVDQFPPLSPAQVDKIAAMLRADRRAGVA